jgi:GPH family glycoside/pentoside/hexuronide:cation symporter
MDEKRKVPFLEKVAYGCGAGGGNVMSTLMSSFLLSYYTDDVLLNAGAVATMFLLCRFLDGITDITMVVSSIRPGRRSERQDPGSLSVPRLC